MCWVVLHLSENAEMFHLFSFSDEHLHCFDCRAIMNNATVNITEVFDPCAVCELLVEYVRLEVFGLEYSCIKFGKKPTIKKNSWLI